MRIAVISHGYKPRIGGAERQLGAILPVLQSRGMDVHVFTRKLKGTPSFEIMDGIPVRRIQVPGPKPVASFLFSVSVLCWIRRIKPDLIHAHEMISPATTALWANQLLGIPFVITPHSSGSDGEVQRVLRKPLGKNRLHAFSQHASAFVTISKAIDQELANIGVQQDKRIAIPNGVNTSEFVPISEVESIELRKNYNISASAPVAIFVGRLVPIKRVDRLVAIWPRVLKSHPDAILLIVGDGPLENSLKTNSPVGIRFLGSRTAVNQILPLANVFILSSESEGLPVSILEAMSCGLPVIAPAVGGIPEVVASDTQGYLYPEGNQEELFNCLHTAFSDLPKTKQQGRLARERILSGYSLDLMADRLINLYSRVLGKPGQR